MSIEKVPNWDCQADDNLVTCAKCGHTFCPGCSDACTKCGNDTVIRDGRWDEEEQEFKKWEQS